MRLLHDPGLLSDTIGAIYDCALDPGRWTVVMGELAALLGASRAFLGVGTPASGMRTIVAAPGYSPQDFTAPEMALNPIVPLGLTLPPDSSLVASRDYGLLQLQATRFYREYLAPRDMLDAIGFAVTREGNGHWFIATPPRHGAITAEEAAGLTLIAPHIRRAVEISRVLGVQRLEAATCRAALGELDSPVLILGPGRRIAFANSSAERAIEGGQVLRRRNGALHGATEQADRLIGRITAGAAAGNPASSEETVTGTDGEERLVFAVFLDLGRHHLWDEAAPSVLLVMRSPRDDTRNPVAVAAHAFGLTPAQVQVLAFLAQGHAPEAIADILGISVTTVRSHLSALFDRTGTSRQAELVARTLSLASPLRPPRQE
jgi:DNA-binding CsgD family transcriptional regulator